MNDAMDLKTLERNAWRSYHQDGLWDIYLGLLLWDMALILGTGLAWLANDWLRFLLYLILLGGAFLIFWAGKRYLTVPRLGRVKFGPVRKRRKLHLALVLGGFFVVTLVLFLLTLAAKLNNAPLPPGLPVFLFTGLFVGAAIATIAWFNDYPRGYYIAVIYALCFGLGEYMNNFAIFWIGGLLVMAPGVYLFVRFLKEHPKSETEGGNG
jgi:hypothetical protein